jgi:hypothetical protein
VTNAYIVDKTLKEKDHKLILQDVRVCACMHKRIFVYACMARWIDKTGEQIYAVVAWILSIKCQLYL